MAKSKAKGGLGRGLGALLPEYDEIIESTDDKSGVKELDIESVVPNPDQPRKIFDEDKMQDLVESVRAHGVIQPILVSKQDDHYIIIAGERRYRACKKAGLDKVPALIRNLDEEQIMEIALIENIQRDDLSPFEEARAYEALQKKFGYTQEKLAERMGKSRSSIANLMRLLALPEDVQKMVEENKLTVGHVRPLLTLDSAEMQSSLAYEIYQNELTVRDVEQLLQDISSAKAKDQDVSEETIEEAKAKRRLSPEMLSLQEQLAERFSTKVSIKKKGDGGKLVIEYYSEDDLKRIIDGMKGEFY